MDELQHRRAMSVGNSTASAALTAAAQDKTPSQGERLMETSLDLLLVMAHGDSVVKGVMCSRDNLQHLLDLLQRLQQPSHLLKVCKEWGVSCPGLALSTGSQHHFCWQSRTSGYLSFAAWSSWGAVYPPDVGRVGTKLSTS